MPSNDFIAFHNVYDVLMMSDSVSESDENTDTGPTTPSVPSVPDMTRTTRAQRMQAKTLLGVKTVFVHRLPPQTTVEELRTVFAPYGTITEIYIPKFKDPSLPSFGTNKSYAFIKFASTDDACLAFQSLFERLVLRTIRVRVTLSKNDQ